MNAVIECKNGDDGSEIMLTCLESSDECEQNTALLTVRSKDTDLGIKELEALSKACEKAVSILKRNGVTG